MHVEKPTKLTNKLTCISILRILGKYVWEQQYLGNLVSSFMSEESQKFEDCFINYIAELVNTNDAARLFSEYMHNAFSRTFD